MIASGATRITILLILNPTPHGRKAKKYNARVTPSLL